MLRLGLDWSKHRSFKFIGNAPLRILKCFTLAMTLATCMRALATLKVTLQFFLESMFLSLKNGAMISLDPLLTSKSLMWNTSFLLNYHQIEVSPQCQKF